jgi:nitroreductase
MNINLKQFIEIARTRRSTRHFLNTPVDAELLQEVLEATRWSPSAFNLQPTHFIVVTDQAIKEKLYPACMNQSQVLEAGATVVFTGDRQVVEHNFDRVLQQELDAHAISAEYEKLLRKNVPLSFNRGFLGLGWLWKFFAETIVGRFIPIPKLQAIHKDYWLAKQASVAAQTFMLAAHVAGLSTCPMEGFSERAVQEVLNIPSSQAVILVIPIGYADNSKQTKTRLSLSELVHQNSW